MIVLPRHVRECHNTGGRNWWIYAWAKSNAAIKTRIPYQCDSWRCPVCARHEAAVTFARIKEATEPLDPSGFVFAVLTIDQKGFYSAEGRPLHKDASAAYKALGKQSELFLKRLRRWQKRRGMTVIKSQWVAVVEAHRSGWPHINFVFYSPELAKYLQAQSARVARLLEHWGAKGIDRRRRLVFGELKEITMSTGWGRQSTIEAARSIDALNGYVTKLAGLADATSGEIAKITQAPTMAPERFRRLRSGKGFLPKRRKNEEYTGTLIRREVSPRDGTPHAVPLHRVSAELQPDVAKCCYLEEAELQKELEAKARGKAAPLCFARELAALPEVARISKVLRPGRVRVYVQNSASIVSLEKTSDRGFGEPGGSEFDPQARPRHGPHR